jgi:hypothetical protein
MNSGRYPAHVLKRFDESDRAMAAHSEISDVVKKDHPGGGIRIHRLAQKCTDDGIVAARLPNDRRAQSVMISLKDRQPVGHGTGSKIGKTVHDNTRWFTACMRIDRFDPFYFGHRTLRIKPQMHPDLHCRKIDFVSKISRFICVNLSIIYL